MKQFHFDLSHHCQSFNIRNHKHFTCSPTSIPPRPRIRCDGTCFQRNFHPSCMHGSMSHPIVQPCFIMPCPCYPLFNGTFHQPPQFDNRKIKPKTLDPSSYRVTVRRMTPPHVAMAAAEAYRAQRNKDSVGIHPEPLDSTTTSSSHQTFRTTPITDIQQKDDFNSDDQNIPSIPTKKIVSKNNGIQVSSTSFITTLDEQKSLVSDLVSETNSEHHTIHSRILEEGPVSMANVEQSSSNHLALSKLNSATGNKNIDPIVNKQQITQQIEPNRQNQIKEHSSDNPRSNNDKIERSEQLSAKEELSSLKFSRNDIPNIIDSNTPLSPNDPSSIDNSHFPSLPSSLPPNIDHIKSNEMLIHFSRPNKSISSLNKDKQKSSTDLTKSNPVLHTTRSTLDFGFLIHETST